MWVIVFALTLVISMGGAYAYFTATATKKQSEMTTAIIKVALTDSQLTTTASGSTTATKILPGSTVQYSGNVVNTGNTDMYALLEFNVYVDGSIIQTTYYTAAGTKLVYSDSLKEYTTGATQIKENASQKFNLSFTFDKTLGNEYKGKTATLKVTAHAIQFRNIASAVAATNLLLDGTSGNMETLPSNYTELAYIQSTGSQWFDTDFQVTADTDNFIVETSVKWTNTAKRQLMGYNGGVSGYFGINASGKYEIGGATGAGITASTNSYDNLRAIRNKTNKIWSLYVNNNLLRNYGAPDDRSGKFQVGCLISSSEYSCYCQMKYFKIYQNDELKYSLMPARDATGVVGMYDTVNAKFYKSATSTDFVSGAKSNPTQLLDSSIYTGSGSKSGLTFSCNRNTGEITVNGTATAASYWNPTATPLNFLVGGHKYLLIGGATVKNNNFYWGLLNQGTSAEDYGAGAICTLDASREKTWGIVWKSGAVFNNFKIKPRLYDLTEMYGAGNEPANAWEVNKDYSRNIWTCNKTSNFYKYDGADQSYTMVNTSSTQCHGSVSVFTLPTAIPTGTTITLSVYCLSGAITEGTLTLGGYHYEGSASSWQNLMTLPLNQNLTGKKFTKTFTTTNTLTDFWLFSYYSTLENVKFKVQLEFGSTATSYQPYLGGLTK